MYEHDRSKMFGKGPKDKNQDDDGSQSEEDQDNMTFGSRPPTAPQKNKTKDGQESKYQTPMQSSVYDADSSMVHMGAITVDKKNHLIGNAFQRPEDNFHHDQSPFNQTVIK